MRVSEVLAHQVTHRCRSRGYEYFVSGAVRELHIGPGIVTAVVQGADEYDVLLEPIDDVLRATCTCPFFADRLEICKHIWATILAAEARRIPIAPAGMAPEAIALEPTDYDVDIGAKASAEASRSYAGALARDNARAARQDQLFHETMAAARPWSPPVLPSRAAPSRPRREPPPWRALLDAVATPPHPEIAPPRLVNGQLIYVIDIPATLGAGVLVIELMTRDRKRNGDWGKPKPARVSAADVRALPGGDDREILERLRGASQQIDYAGYSDHDFGRELSRLRLSDALVRDVLPQLCATERAFARVPDPGAPQTLAPPRSRYLPQTSERTVLIPLAWDPGDAWRFGVGIRRDEANDVYSIDASLCRGDERMGVQEPLAVLPDGLLVTSTRVARLDHGGAFAWLAACRRTGAVTVPTSARSAIADALLSQAPRLTEAPDELRIEIVLGTPRPRLRLHPMRRADRLRATLTFDYEAMQVDAAAPEALVRSGETRAIRRDRTAERSHAEALHRLGCRREWDDETRTRALQLPTLRAGRVIQTLLADGWHVEGAAGVYRRPGAVRVTVSSGIDWFDLSARVDYDGRAAALPQLLAALERGDGFVTLSDGSMGLLPDEWLRKHGLVVRLGAIDGDSIRYRRSQLALLDALLASQPEATWDDTYQRARAELQRFEGIRPLDPAASFSGTLRDYQREGLGWLAFLQQFGFGGCLADDMGLGKTVMVLALLDLRRDRQPDHDRRPSLVVAPRSVVFNWIREAARFAPRLRVVDYSGTGRARLSDRLGDADLVLTTYGTLRRDAALLSGQRFDYAVLDESQAIKNAGTASAKSVRLLDARFRLALSGTPIENHLGELRSLFDFLNPGLFGRSAFAGSGALDEESLAVLARGLRPFILRRTKEQVASELPPKSEQTLYCELEKPQRALYNELRDHYRHVLLEGLDAAGLKRAKLQVLEALLRLRQAACHPGLVDGKRLGAGSAKLDVLVPRLLETIEEGHKALVFSQFTSFLDIVRRALDRRNVTYEYLDGRTRDRAARIDRFQTDPACRLFLISLKAGGVGLNLTRVPHGSATAAPAAVSSSR